MDKRNEKPFFATSLLNFAHVFSDSGPGDQDAQEKPARFYRNGFAPSSRFYMIPRPEIFDQGLISYTPSIMMKQFGSFSVREGIRNARLVGIALALGPISISMSIQRARELPTKLCTSADVAAKAHRTSALTLKRYQRYSIDPKAD